MDSFYSCIDEDSEEEIETEIETDATGTDLIENRIYDALLIRDSPSSSLT